MSPGRYRGIVCRTPETLTDATIAGHRLRRRPAAGNAARQPAAPAHVAVRPGGVICVQIHSGPPSEAWYRDITLTELKPSEPVVKVPLHSTSDASLLAALLLPQLLPVFSVVAPCQAGASPVSVPRGTFTTGS
jgi:hypothetical protein